MAGIKVGVQLHPQHTTTEDLRRAWRAVDGAGFDSCWVWDHFYPLYGEPDGSHFEGWTLLAAMAVDTTKVTFGALVTCNTYRNPDLLADMARTVDHLSGGRFVLGLGAGWFERDYEEYGYEFGTPGSRLRDLEASLERIEARRAALHPPPAGPLPVLIGGGGEKVTLRLVAQHAQIWNGFGPAEEFRKKNGVLDRWCAEVGRDPAEIERSAAILGVPEDAEVEALVDAGAQHLILGVGHPFDLDGAERVRTLVA